MKIREVEYLPSCEWPFAGLIDSPIQWDFSRPVEDKTLEIDVPLACIKPLMKCYRTTNAEPFYDAPPGTVQMLYFDGVRVSDARWNVKVVLNRNQAGHVLRFLVNS